MKKAFGSLDILVNNAGVYRPMTLDEMTEEEFHREFATNVLGPLLVIRESLNYFGPSGGSVINIGSSASRMCPPGYAIYAASKSALDAITGVLAKELAPRKIRVNSINPVFIIILSGVFAALWTKLGRRQPSTPIKFAAGVIVMGLAFLLFLPFASDGPSATPLLAIVGILFVFTVAELLISPVGLSAATKLAPARFQTQMVALFFLSVSLGTAISGLLAPFYDPENEVPYFSILAAIAIILGLALAAARKPVLALMRDVR